MSTSVSMPALGESVSEGTVTRWLKHEGDSVEADEPLLEVSTDKVDTEIPSPAAGVLQKILVGEDETVAVGAELAVIGDGNEGGATPGGGDAQQPQEGGSQPQEGSSPEGASAEHSAEPPAAQGPAEQDHSAAAPSSETGGDSTPVTMPALGESVTEGTVTRWLKAEGDEGAADEPLLEVSTDKVDTEIPAPAAGVLQKILVGADETVAVGTQLAVIGGVAAGETTEQQQAPQQQAPQQPAPQQPAPQQQAPQQQAPQQPEEQPQPEPRQAAQQPPPEAHAPAPEAPAPAAASPGDAGGSGADGDASAYVTPLVRKLASEHGVDLSSLSGTGVGGRIRKQDVLEAATAAKARQEAPPTADRSAAASAPSRSGAGLISPLRGTTEKMSRLRKVIAQRMVESLQMSAQLTTVVEVDLTRIARLRTRSKAEFEARENVKLSFLPFLAKATVEALKDHPKLNAGIDIDKGEITYYDAEHLGIAVDTERGLLVPVVKHAGDLNIAGLARKIADLAERTRNNRIMPDELAGGTFTLTNTGSRGALFDTPIINQPQVGILGTGAVVKRPVVVDDADLGETIAIRSMCYLALSYDHRLVDGADAARFLTTVKQRLEEGKFEADLGL